jgi:hypothetical protein
MHLGINASDVRRIIILAEPAEGTATSISLDSLTDTLPKNILMACIGIVMPMLADSILVCVYLVLESRI